MNKSEISNETYEAKLIARGDKGKRRWWRRLPLLTILTLLACVIYAVRDIPPDYWFLNGQPFVRFFIIFVAILFLIYVKMKQIFIHDLYEDQFHLSLKRGSFVLSEIPFSKIRAIRYRDFTKVGGRHKERGLGLVLDDAIGGLIQRISSAINYKLFRCHILLPDCYSQSLSEVAKDIAHRAEEVSGKKIPISVAGVDEKTSEDTQPVGFCPRCDYPINPGQCTECGKIYTEEQLDLAPAKIRKIARYKRWMFQFFTILPILAVVYYIPYIDLIPSLPTSYLSKPAADPSRYRGAAELSKRFWNGKLTQEQASDVFKNAIYLNSKKILPDVIPSGYPLYVNAYFKNLLSSYLYLGIKTNECSVYIDGKYVDTAREVLKFIDGSRSSSKIREKCWVGEIYQRIAIDDLAEGEHHVKYKVQFAYDMSQVNLLGLSNIFPHATIEHEQVIKVVDQTIHEIIRPRWSQARANQLLQEFVLDVEYKSYSRAEENRNYINVKPEFNQDFFSYLAGHYYFQTENGKTFRKLRTNKLFDINDAYWIYGLLNFSSNVKDVQFVDICFIPDARVALSENTSEYFNGVIEWNNVKLSCQSNGDDDNQCDDREAKQVLPTRIYQYNPETFEHQLIDDDEQDNST